MGPRGAGGYNHGSYLELAVQASGESSSRARLRELAECEAEIIADPSPIVRMHTCCAARSRTRTGGERALSCGCGPADAKPRHLFSDGIH